jgi:hypothetical protein
MFKIVQLSLLFWIVAPLAHAYDVDTHFYATYAMARYAGIRSEVAAKIATGAQWMDESFISDPTSMLLLPVTGVQKRRMLHFPSSRIGGHVAAKIQDESLGFREFTGVQAKVAEKIYQYCNFNPDDVGTLLAHTQTEPNHEFASQLLMQGLKEGNLMKASLSLHVIEDSYAHSGVAAEEGHTLLWHWPDRPYDAVPKYFEMVETLFKALTAIRAQLPPAALDCQVQLSGGSQPNCQQTSTQLYATYAQIPSLRQTISLDPLLDFNFIREVLRSFISKALAENYLRPQPGVDFEHELDLLMQQEVFFQGKIDTYDMLELYILRLVNASTHEAQLLDGAKIARDMGLYSDGQLSFSEFVKSYARVGGPDADPTGLKPFLHVMVRRILRGFVPMPLDAYHREELEDDSALPRQLEMKMRVAGMQKVIADLFGDHVEFIENNSKDEIGFAHEVLLDSAAEPTIPSTKDVSYITFSLAEKNRFDQTIFQFLFPSLEAKDLVILTKAIRDMKDNHLPTVWSHYAELRQELSEQERGVLRHLWDVSSSYPAEAWALVTSPLREIEQVQILYPLVKPLCYDTLNAHLRPNGDELIYQNEENLQRVKARSQNLYPTFLGEQDVWHTQDLLKQNEVRL